MENTAKSKHCSKCLILEDKSVGIIIGNDGVCNLCKKDTSRYEGMSWEKKKEVFDTLINKEKGRHKYDGVVMMSGGKDSTYLAMKLTQEYHLNIVGMSIDNGFEYLESFTNARNMCDKLNIPYLIYQPKMHDLREFYKYIATDDILRRSDYGQICFYCGIYLKKLVSDYAKLIDAPYILSGYNPDQVMELGESDIIEIAPSKIEYQQMIKRSAEEKVRSAEKYTFDKLGSIMSDYFKLPDLPILYYYQHFPYDPLEMIREIKEKLGWEPIPRFQKHYIASGCKLACALIHFCQLKNKPDYIQKEFCGQIRRGVLNKEDVEKLLGEIKFSTDEINEVLNKLDITSEEMLNL